MTGTRPDPAHVDPEPTLVDTATAAVAARVAPATIRDWARRGLLTPHGGNHRQRWDLDQVDRVATELAARRPRRNESEDRW